MADIHARASGTSVRATVHPMHVLCCVWGDSVWRLRITDTVTNVTWVVVRAGWRGISAAVRVSRIDGGSGEDFRWGDSGVVV